jgi:light-regulated signal transduction histidine kinase (bacteriophytochrome)
MPQILVVEDEAIVAESIASKLGKIGYQVAGPVSTGEDAVRVAGEVRPDVILMDIHLAGTIDGIEAAGEITEKFHIPVIFLTAYADDKTLERAKEVKPFGYIIKPFRERDLDATIRMAQERSKLEAELEAANRELDTFSYSVSHDLRAPLIAIEGFSRILEESYLDLLPQDGQDCLHRIRQAAIFMDQLVNDFLRLSRVTRTSLVIETVDISAMASGILEGLKRGDPEREVEWNIKPGITVRADKGLILIALQNLLGNSWKYTSKKQEAKIEMGITERGGGRAVFIRDNGAGFPPEKAGLLFIPLQRLHSSEEFPGTGIGLATVQRIVFRHGGKIWAESVVDGGATFSFTTPDLSVRE